MPSIGISGLREAWEVTDFLFGGPRPPAVAAAWLEGALRDQSDLSLGPGEWSAIRDAAVEWLGRPIAPSPPFP